MPFPLFLAQATAIPPPAQVARNERPSSTSDATGDLGPPADPGNEIRILSDSSGVAAECGHIAAKFAKRGLLVARSVTSKNEQYGVVWRADLVMRTAPDDEARFLCWRAGSGGYQISLRPLQMFDESQSIEPLKPDIRGPAPSAPGPVSPSR